MTNKISDPINKDLMLKELKSIQDRGLYMNHGRVVGKELFYRNITSHGILELYRPILENIEVAVSFDITRKQLKHLYKLECRNDSLWYKIKNKFEFIKSKLGLFYRK